MVTKENVTDDGIKERKMCQPPRKKIVIIMVNIVEFTSFFILNNSYFIFVEGLDIHEQILLQAFQNFVFRLGSEK